MSLLDGPVCGNLAVPAAGLAVVVLGGWAGSTGGVLFGMGLAAGGVLQLVISSTTEEVRRVRERERELLGLARRSGRGPPPGPPPRP